MRTTLDLPDGVFRRLKARAAIEGVPMKDLIARYVAAGLHRSEIPEGEGRVSDAGVAAEPFVSAFDLMQEGAGVADSGHADLATNPAHLEDLGRE